MGGSARTTVQRLATVAAAFVAGCSLTLPADSEYVGETGLGGVAGVSSGGTGAAVTGGAAGAGGALTGGNGGTGATGGVAGTGGASGASGSTSGGGTSATGGTAGTGATGGTAGTGATGGTAGTGATGGTGGSGGVPTTGLELWLDATGLSVGSLGTWPDKSGKNKNAVQATASSRPTVTANGLNGHEVVTFDGVDDYFSLPTGFKDFTAGISIFIVLQASKATQNEGHIFLGNSGNADLIRFSRDYNYESAVFNTNTNDVVYSTKGTYKVGFPTLLSGLQIPGSTTATTRLYIDTALQMEAQLPPATNSTRTLNWVGRSNLSGTFFAGYMAEIIVYSRALSATELTQVNGYLQQKYACCGN
jgi:hypothetical protein